MNKVLALIIYVCASLAASCSQRVTVVKIPLDGRNDYTYIVLEVLQHQ